MIAPEIRYLHSPDVSDLAGHTPTDPSCFAVLVQLMVGPGDGPGEESFDVHIVTPSWLEEELDRSGIVSGEFKLVVATYDWARTERYLRDRVAECAAEDWAGVARKLGRFARWEFDEYRVNDSQHGGA